MKMNKTQLCLAAALLLTGAPRIQSTTNENEFDCSALENVIENSAELHYASDIGTNELLEPGEHKKTKIRGSIYDSLPSPNAEDNWEKIDKEETERIGERKWKHTAVEYDDAFTNHVVKGQQCAWEIVKEHNKELKHDDHVKLFLNAIYCMDNDKDPLYMHFYGNRNWKMKDGVNKDLKRNPHFMKPGEKVIVALINDMDRGDLPEGLQKIIGSAGKYYYAVRPGTNEVVFFNFKTGLGAAKERDRYIVFTPKLGSHYEVNF